MGDILVVGNTTILVHLHEVVVVDGLHLIALSDIRSKEPRIEIGGGLIGIKATAVEVVDVETKGQALVGIDGEVRLEALLTIQLIACFIVR